MGCVLESNNVETFKLENQVVVHLDGLPFILPEGSELRGVRDNWDLANKGILAPTKVS